MSQLIVGVDESPCSAAALRWAVREARARGWKVTALHAWDWLEHGHAVADNFDSADGEREAAASLDRILTEALGGNGAGDVLRSVVRGRPVPALLEATSDAELLVLGARGLGGLKSLVLGSVSHQCTHHASCPVVVVREQGPPRSTIDRITVGVDGSESSRRALAWAVDAARVHDAVVDVVHAWTFPAMAGEVVVAMAYDPDQLAAAGHRLVDEAIASTDANGLVPRIQRTVVGGAAASVILEAAGSSDLVVVGSRGRGGFAELLLGSVSQHVLHHPPCPVVVLPAQSRAG